MMRSILFSIIILALAGGVGAGLWYFRPKPEEKEMVVLVTPVEIEVVKRQDVSLGVASQGVIEAKTLTSAASEVSGKVIEVSAAFEAGGRFDEGDVLLRIDDADYRAALAQAKSSVADAELALQVEEAKAGQSLRDWKKLGRRKDASGLVKREPQLASATARLEAAKAGVEKAERDLDRTVLKAPYAGRIIRTFTDLGSFAAAGATLSEFYAANALEVRLPVPLDDLRFVDLSKPGTPVALTASTGQSWTAKIVRQDSEIDRRSGSLSLIAELEPERVANDPLLVPGLFVRARIEGETLTKVFEIPRRALQNEDELVLVTDEEKLTRRKVTVLRKETDTVLVSEGLENGDRVCVSFLAAFVEGMQVRVVESEKP
ncbi:MAG: RND family efflux transporter MFP subunit [Verrucomicrobiales bacterium]|jgi:RND family efflux transporter MFP subunit